MTLVHCKFNSLSLLLFSVNPLQADAISKNGGSAKAEISLKDYAPGTYFAKCYNESFEQYFKVIKI